MLKISWRETEQGLKSHRITNWRQRGVKHDDFNKLYDYFLSIKACQNCDIELSEGRLGDGRCLDHDHTDGLFRQVLCRSCNSLRQ